MKQLVILPKRNGKHTVYKKLEYGYKLIFCGNTIALFMLLDHYLSKHYKLKWLDEDNEDEHIKVNNTYIKWSKK